MSKMELVYDDKIRRMGKNTAAIYIPASIMKVLGVTVDSRVLMYKEGDTLMLKFPKDGEKPEEF
jgi:antitoxin component of MazEF toxin-antitoxin module